MIMVMPLGYGAPEFCAPTQGCSAIARSRIETSINPRGFCCTEVLRRVEPNIPLLKTANPRHRAFPWWLGILADGPETLDNLLVGAF